jgi:hypothetical protein
MANVPRAKTFVDDTGQHPPVVDRTTSDRDVTDLGVNPAHYLCFDPRHGVR